jgi:hypothetical protein
MVDSTVEVTGWYLPDNEVNLSDYFEILVNKTWFYFDYYRSRV